MNAAAKAHLSKSRKAYFKRIRRIAKTHGCSFGEARLIDKGLEAGSPEAHSNGLVEPHVNGASDSPVQRKLKAARALIAECDGDTAVAAEFMEILEAIG